MSNTGMYDRIVHDYIEKDGGIIVLLSEDSLFQRTLRSTVTKIIGSKKDCLSFSGSTSSAVKTVKKCQERGIPTVVFVERILSGKPSTDFIIAMKNLIPELKIIVLVGETRRENIAYFYELGVNNVISKPASMNNIIEKLAFTIKPQGKLSELMSEGKMLLAEGDYQGALKVSTKILKIKPGSPAGLMLAGDCHLEQGERDKAIRAYLQAHESSRLYLEPLKKLANVYQDVNENEHLKYLKKLDRLSPLNTERKCEIGAAHIRRKEMDMAEKYFDQAIDTATQEAMSLVSGVAERIAGTVAESSPKMSEKYLQKVLETKGANLSKDDITTFNKLGIALRSQGKWREAIDNYKHALQISPEDEGLHFNMGLAYRDGGERRKALECYERALDFGPDLYKASANVAIQFGDLYAEVKRLDDALKFYSTAVEMSPDNRTARDKLAAVQKLLKG
ncbi:response regulator [Salidesulfovibrio onnuriiensis]|uniref:response regulator n=1 Tax=Salidesulfovibrio onnuriiensis TaxID=2583823 RepID=UPI0011CBEBF4|nr:response regulator [Salidesulfovibrio onnuriiensis]